MAGRSILLVDDDDGDAELTLIHFREAGFDHAFSRVVDGRDALDVLERRLSAGESLPDLIVLDLKMPRIDGHEFLEQAALDPRIKAIPVVMMSNSAAPQDRARALALGARDYFVKPDDGRGMLEVVRRLEEIMGGSA